MQWYYSIGIIEGTPITNSTETGDLEGKVLSARPVPATGLLENGVEVETVSRFALPPPKRLEFIRHLSEEKARADSPSERRNINNIIRAEKQAFMYFAAGFGRVYDLHGNPMARIHSREDSPYSFVLGDNGYFSGFRFDFVEGNRHANEKRICLRTTAILTNEGIKEAERYLVRSFRDTTRTAHSNVRYSMSRAEAKRILEKRNTYDVNVASNHAHISLNGKIELFAACPPEISDLLVPPDAFPGSVGRFRQYTQSFRYKQWVGHTTEYTNSFIGSAFEKLANVLGEVIR